MRLISVWAAFSVLEPYNGGLLKFYSKNKSLQDPLAANFLVKIKFSYFSYNIKLFFLKKEPLDYRCDFIFCTAVFMLPGLMTAVLGKKSFHDHTRACFL